MKTAFRTDTLSGSEKKPSMQNTMIILNCLRQMSIGMEPKTYTCSCKTPSVTSCFQETIVKVTSNELMFR